ncbi:hypothetical protein [Actinophytocola sp. KF-1]
MDPETLEAVAVVDIDPGQAGEWFDVVEAAHSTSNGDWDTFSEQLRSTAGGGFDTAVKTFLWYAADHGKMELIDKLVADPGALPSAYANSREQAAEPQPGSWDTVVELFGSGWAGWDGSEEGWAQFRDWTYTSANAQDPALYAVAYEGLAPLDDLPLAERIARMTGLGFEINAQPPDEQAGDPWSDVVRDFGPGWANWDGSDEGWAQFRDWTYTSANAQDPALYAAAYEKLAPLDELPAAARIARLTEFGFAVQASPQPDGGSAESAAVPGEPSADPIIEEALAEALAEVPGAENLTAEELTRMRAEIAEELAKEAAEETAEPEDAS